MRRHLSLIHGLLATAVAALLAGAAASAEAPIAIDSARVTIAGTSNVHEYTASTDKVRITRAQLAAEGGAAFWEQALKPGAAIEAFEVSIPAASLTSPKEGLDKNMHKALKVQEHAEIVFRLTRFEAADGGALKGIGVLRIAGVEREIVLNIKAKRTDRTLTVSGEVPIVMTDFGIKPPTAMMGLLKTDPKVTVTFETVLTAPGAVKTE